MIETDGIYLYEVQKYNGGEARGVIGNHTKLVLTGPNEIAANVPEAILAEYQDYQGNLLPGENRDIIISVNDVEQVTTPVDGRAEFDFMSNAPGTHAISARTGFPCDSAKIEVVVS